MTVARKAGRRQFGQESPGKAAARVFGSVAVAMLLLLGALVVTRSTAAQPVNGGHRLDALGVIQSVETTRPVA